LLLALMFYTIFSNISPIYSVKYTLFCFKLGKFLQNLIIFWNLSLFCHCYKDRLLDKRKFVSVRSYRGEECSWKLSRKANTKIKIFVGPSFVLFVFYDLSRTLPTTILARLSSFFVESCGACPRFRVYRDPSTPYARNFARLIRHKKMTRTCQLMMMTSALSVRQ